MKKLQAQMLSGLTALFLGVPLEAGEYDCVIEPSQVVAVRAPVQGLIVKITADRGERVKKGQILLVLEDRLEQANAELARFRSTMQGAIRSSESRVEYAEVKAARSAQLLEENFVSAQERDEAATELRLAQSDLLETRDNQQVAELEYVRAREELRLRTVHSPIDGIVVERLMQPGELADNQSPDRPILRLANTSLLHVEALLPLDAYREVVAGMHATVVPEDPIGGAFDATVSVVDSIIDTASGTFGVRLKLPNPDQRIPAGVKCRVLLVSEPDGMQGS